MDESAKSQIGRGRAILSGVAVVALLAGLIVSAVHGFNSQPADYSLGCGYGYGSNGSAGYGANYGYGYGYGGSFGYGYGDQICSLSISTTSLPNGTVGSSYNFQMYGTGGSGLYTWSETGSFPPGLTLSSSGLIIGTPTVAGTYNFTATMTDSNLMSVSGPFTLTIMPASSGGGGGGGTTTTTAPPGSTTTTSPVTTTTAPARHGHPRLVFIRLIEVNSIGAKVVVRCLGAPCHAKAILVGRVLVAGHLRLIVIATRELAVGRGQTGTYELLYTPAGKRFVDGVRTNIVGGLALRFANLH